MLTVLSALSLSLSLSPPSANCQDSIDYDSSVSTFLITLSLYKTHVELNDMKYFSPNREELMLEESPNG
jgi:hypothetical protein